MKRTRSLITRRAVLAAGLASGCAHVPTSGGMGIITRLHPSFDAVIAPGAIIEPIARGLDWAEGPLWVGDHLLFSDVPQNVIYRWDAHGGVSEFLRPSGLAHPDPAITREAGANGLALEANGVLVLCDSGSRALARVDLRTKAKTIFVERFENKRFNSPNDLCIARRGVKAGAIYFTDPPYGLTQINASPSKELAFNGVFHVTPSGVVTAIDRTMTFPNGVALSPDEHTLYVSNTDTSSPIIRAYALNGDGLPTSSRTFFDATSLQGANVSGHPDGMCVDDAGRIFATGPGGILVLSPQGELLGVVGAERTISNCAFGEDGRTLFFTADDIVARVRTRTRGQPGN